MITYSRVTEQPANEPVSLSDAKVHLEYTGTAKNAYITSLIKSARRICEGYAGLSFVTQTRQIKMDKFPYNALFISVPYGPVQSISSFTYLNDNGGTTTLVENTDFIADYDSGVCRLYAIGTDGDIDTWPTDLRDRPQVVTITYVSGYDETINEPLPEQIKQAILLQVAAMFENRQDEVPGSSNLINWNSMAILDTVKVSWNANVD